MHSFWDTGTKNLVNQGFILLQKQNICKKCTLMSYIIQCRRNECGKRVVGKATLVDCCNNVRCDLSCVPTRGFMRHFASTCLYASLRAASNPSANKQSSWFTWSLLEIISPNCENREMNAENVSSEKFSRSYSGWLLQQCETRRDLSCVRTLHTWFCASLCVATRLNASLRAASYTLASSVVPIVGSVKTQAEYTAHYGQFLS